MNEKYKSFLIFRKRSEGIKEPVGNLDQMGVGNLLNKKADDTVRLFFKNWNNIMVFTQA